MFNLDYAARSDVGLVRASNQDSAYAGPDLLLVADGMGGHAGGDVASAIAVAAIEHVDQQYHSPAAALAALEAAIEEARLALIHASATNPRLAGLGTTVVALLRTDNTLALAHMGDSRAYLLRDGELSQVTVDHTFVQHLVDTGRIAPEEAAHHPNRNVVMRVLSDFDVELRADLLVIAARPGDRWLLCSDGLSGFVELDELKRLLSAGHSPGDTADALIEAAKAAASTDNITAIVADVVPAAAALAAGTIGRDNPAVEVVGAAATGGPMPELVASSVEAVRQLPEVSHAHRAEGDDAVPMSPSEFAAEGLLTYTAAADAEADAAAARKQAPPTEPIQLDAAAAGLLAAGLTPEPVAVSAEDPPRWVIPYNVPLGQTPVGQIPLGQIRIDDPEYAVSPASLTEFDDDESGRPAPRRHPWLAALITAGVLAVLAFAGWWGYRWTQTQYYVGELAGMVAIYRGVPQNLGPIRLNEAVDLLDTHVEDLPHFFADRLDGSIRTNSLADARERADRLIADALASEPQPRTTPVPNPYPETPTVQPTTPERTTPTIQGPTPAQTSPAPTTPAQTPAPARTPATTSPAQTSPAPTTPARTGAETGTATS